MAIPESQMFVSGSPGNEFFGLEDIDTFRFGQFGIDGSLASKIYYGEEFADGLPQTSFSPSAARVTRRFNLTGGSLDVEGGCIQPEDVYQFCRALVGYPRVIGDVLYRRLPDRIPWYLNNGDKAFLFCTSCPKVYGVGPKGVLVPTIDLEDLGYLQKEYYKHYIVEAVYETLSYEVLQFGDITDESQRFTTITSKASAEMLTAASGQILWNGGSFPGEPPSGQKVTDGAPVTSGIGRVVGQREVQVIWHDVPDGAFDFDRFDRFLGKVNQFDNFLAPADAVFTGYAKETMLLLSWEPFPVVSAIGDRLHRIVMNFLYLPNVSSVDGLPKGHNWKLSPLGYWQAVKLKSGLPMYQTVDMSELFLPP